MVAKKDRAGLSRRSVVKGLVAGAGAIAAPAIIGVRKVRAETGVIRMMGGPTVAGGMMFLHSGYNGSAGASNLLLAFTVDGK